MTWFDLMYEIDEHNEERWPWQTARIKLNIPDSNMAKICAVKLIKDFDGEWTLVLDADAPENPYDQ